VTQPELVYEFVFPCARSFWAGLQPMIRIVESLPGWTVWLGCQAADTSYWLMMVTPCLPKSHVVRGATRLAPQIGCLAGGEAIREIEAEGLHSQRPVHVP